MSDDDTPQAESDKADPVKLKYLTRVTLRKFEGDGTSGDPVETIVRKDDGFDERVAQIVAEIESALPSATVHKFEKEDPNAVD